MSLRPPKKPSLTLDSSIVQDDLPQEVIPRDSLQTHGITHILNAARLPVTFPKQFTYLSVEIRDKGDSNILSCIPTANIFIEAGVENGGTLVHCFGAYSAVKKARPIIEINAGFECQLRAYAVAKYDVYVAQQVLLRRRIRDLHQVREQQQNSISNNGNGFSQSNGVISLEVPPHVIPPHSDSISNMTESNHNNSSSSLSDMARLELESREQSPESIRRISALHKRTWRDAKSDGAHLEVKFADADNSVDNSGMMDLDCSSVAESSSNSVASGLIGLGGIVEGSSRASFRRSGSSRSIRSNRRRDSMFPGINGSIAEVETKTPTCRLSRPGSSWVRVMPPLRGLEREFKCSWCNASLFSLANVIRVDIDTLPLLDQFRAEEKSVAGSSEQFTLYHGNSALCDAAKDALSSNSDSISSSTNGSTHSRGAASTRASMANLNLFNQGTGGASNSDQLLMMQMSPNFLPKGQPIDDLPSSGSLPWSNRGDRMSATSTRMSLSLNFCSDSKSASYNNGLKSKPLSPIAAFNNSGGSMNFNSVSSRPSSATNTLYAGLQHPGGSIGGSGSGSIDDSPRVMIPPHRLNEIGWSPVDRPQSAEKRRWLARVNLLREGDSKVAKLADDDDRAAVLAFGRDKYFYIEYMPWMGKDVFQSNKDIGDICCSDCHNIVGSWLWKPSTRLLQNGKFEAPLFLIHKRVVQQSDLPFDSTPLSTPRDI
eukprot:gene28733-37729_t